MQFEKHSNFLIKEAETHVWVVDLSSQDQNKSRYRQFLDHSEKERAARFIFQKDQDCFIITRGILRQLLANYLATDPQSVRFEYGPQGKPEVINDKRLNFNVSHSGEYAIMGFCLNAAIGIDVELIQTDIEFGNIAKHFFSEKEITSLLELPEHQLSRGFYNCWTRKEAFIKAKGDGLSFPLDKFVVSLKPGDDPKLLEITTRPEEVNRWSLFAFEPADGYVGAMAVEAQVQRVFYFQLQNL